jgi:hypothetical protein
VPDPIGGGVPGVITPLLVFVFWKLGHAANAVTDSANTNATARKIDSAFLANNFITRSLSGA